MKKVIFIGGTSYSGSTLLDLILSNSPSGFSCGEVCAFFYPYREHHVKPLCGCGNPDCQVWRTIKNSGLKNLYTTIFKLFPKVDFIVDSSKDPLWISDRTSELREQGIDVRNILIWKSPVEFYHSRAKRNKEKGWQKEWTRYHKLYFRMIKEWYSIRYIDLVSRAESIRKASAYLGIEYFEGKEKFWNKTQHSLFGNTSAKIHLYRRGSGNYQTYKRENESRIRNPNNTGETPHQAVYYEDPSVDNAGIIINKVMRNIETLLMTTGAERNAMHPEVKVEYAKLQSMSFYEYYSRGKRAIVRYFSFLSPNYKGREV